jgi:asparagine synthetase B (glutamine-hydrolysing)
MLEYKYYIHGSFPPKYVDNTKEHNILGRERIFGGYFYVSIHKKKSIFFSSEAKFLVKESRVRELL